MTVATQTTNPAPLSATVEAMRQAHVAALKQIAEARQSLLALIGDDAPLATEMQALNATVAAVNSHIAEQISQVQALVAGVQANFASAAQTIAQALTGMTGTVSETDATTQSETDGTTQTQTTEKVTFDDPKVQAIFDRMVKEDAEEQVALLASETTRESIEVLALVLPPVVFQTAHVNGTIDTPANTPTIALDVTQIEGDTTPNPSLPEATENVQDEDGDIVIPFVAGEVEAPQPSLFPAGDELAKPETPTDADDVASALADADDDDDDDDADADDEEDEDEIADDAAVLTAANAAVAPVAPPQVKAGPEISPAVRTALEELRRDPSRSNVAVGRAAGVSEHTVRQARKIFFSQRAK